MNPDHDQCQMSVELRAKMEAMAKDYERRNAETVMLWQTCDQLGRDMVEIKTTMRLLVDMQQAQIQKYEKHIADSVERVKKIEELDQFKKSATWGLGIVFTAIVGLVVEMFKGR